MSRRNPKPPTVPDAIGEYREAEQLICASCKAPIEPGGEWDRYCFSCGSYWQDIDNGLFEDDDDWGFGT